MNTTTLTEEKTELMVLRTYDGNEKWLEICETAIEDRKVKIFRGSELKPVYLHELARLKEFRDLPVAKTAILFWLEDGDKPYVLGMYVTLDPNADDFPAVPVNSNISLTEFAPQWLKVW